MSRADVVVVAKVASDFQICDPRRRSEDSARQSGMSWASYLVVDERRSFLIPTTRNLLSSQYKEYYA
jgi:hypothetical protein